MTFSFKGLLGFCIIWFCLLSVCRSVWGASLDNKKLPLVRTFVFISKNISKLYYNISSKYDNPYPKLFESSIQFNLFEQGCKYQRYLIFWIPSRLVVAGGVGSQGKRGVITRVCIKSIPMNRCKLCVSLLYFVLAILGVSLVFLVAVWAYFKNHCIQFRFRKLMIFSFPQKSKRWNTF